MKYLVYWNKSRRTAGIEYHDSRLPINYKSVGPNSGCILKRIYPSRIKAESAVEELNKKYATGEYMGGN